MRNRKVAIYCRIDRGANPEFVQQGIEQQKKQLLDYAQHNALDIVGCYEDAGYSGFDVNRPGLRKLLEDAKTGKFDTVLVDSWSRLLRNTQEFCQFPLKIISAIAGETDQTYQVIARFERLGIAQKLSVMRE